MLSLAPRHDLFRFYFPKDLINNEIETAISEILSKRNGPIISPIDYLNESIVSVTLPGMSDLVFNNTGHTWYDKERYVYSVDNPLQKISKEFKVTLRINQGFYNYFMIMNKILSEHHKLPLKLKDDFLELKVLNSIGEVFGIVRFYNCVLKSIDKLNLSYNKIERQTETFEITFGFSNIDFITD